jgi:hypothetical protein
MTTQVATAPDAELRWREWQARGAESDRRTARRMPRLLLLVAVGIFVWFVIQVA